MTSFFSPRSHCEYYFILLFDIRDDQSRAQTQCFLNLEIVFIVVVKIRLQETTFCSGAIGHRKNLVQKRDVVVEKTNSEVYGRCDEFTKVQNGTKFKVEGYFKLLRTATMREVFNSFRVSVNTIGNGRTTEDVYV